MTGFHAAPARRVRHAILTALFVGALTACGPAADPTGGAEDAAAPVALAPASCTPTFTATPSGTKLRLAATSCLTRPEFRFIGRPPGGTVYQTLRSWGGATFAWETAAVAGGRWDLMAQSRTIGTSALVSTSLNVLVGVTCGTAALAGTPKVGNVLSLAAAAGCTAGAVPEYRFVARAPGSATYTELRAWDAAAAFDWSTAGAIGRYEVVVYARAKGNASAYEGSASITWTGVPACTGVSLGVVPGWEPRVNLASVAACASPAVPEYRFLARAPGAAEPVEIRPYGAYPGIIWDPAGLAPGRWELIVQARAQGHPEPYEAQASLVQAVGAFCPGLSLVGTPGDGAVANLSALATCTAGAAPEYRFTATGPGTTAPQLLRDWSASGELAWDTSLFAVGGWTVQAEARAAGVGSPSDAQLTLDWQVLDTTPPVTTPSVAGGDYGTVGQVVTLAYSDRQSGPALTLYSLDGSEPTLQYGGRIPIYATADLCFRSLDTAGNMEATRCEHYVVDTRHTAAHDTTFRAPICAQPGTACDTGPALVLGRGQVGPEPSYPNTIFGACADGAAGAFHASESIDQVRIATVDGGPLAPGALVRIEATAWAQSPGAAVDLYLAADASNPAWTPVSTSSASAPGLRTFSGTTFLPPGGLMAVRAQIRGSTNGGPCTAGTTADRDDLVFAAELPLEALWRDTALITSPAAGAELSGSVAVDVAVRTRTTVTAVGVRVDGILVGTDPAPPWTLTWNAAAATLGAHTLQAIAATADGRSISGDPVVVQVVDRTPPSVSLTAPAAGALVQDGVVLQASASDARGVAKVEFLVDGVVVATDATAPYSATWSSAGHADGPAMLQARATDVGGNVTTSNPRSIVVDHTSPAVAVTSPLAGAIVSDAGLVRFGATATDANGVRSVQYLVDGALVGGPTAAPFTLDWSAQSMALGPHTVTALATDRAGLQAKSPAVPFTLVDGTPPAVALFSPAPGDVVGGQLGFGYQASDQHGLAPGAQVLADGLPVALDPITVGLGTWNTTTWPDGPVTLTLAVQDLAGNVGLSAPAPVVVDNQPPTVALTSPAPDQVVTGPMALTAEAWDAAGLVRVDFYDDAVLVGSVTTSPWSVPWAVDASAPRSATITAVAVDLAGHQAAASVLVQVGEPVPPITFVSPRQGEEVRGYVPVLVEVADQVPGTWVGFYTADGMPFAADDEAPFDGVWSGNGLPSGPVTIYAEAFTSRGLVRSAQLTFLHVGGVGAAWDDAAGASVCRLAIPFCASDAPGRGPDVGPGTVQSEQRQPNTIDGCADGLAVAGMTDGWIDSLGYYVEDGFDLTAGKAITIQAVYSAVGLPGFDEALDLWYADDAAAPAWTLVGSQPAPSQYNTAIFSFQLPEAGAPRRALRASIRAADLPVLPCLPDAGDRDDLILEVKPGGPDVEPPRIAITDVADGQSVFADLPVQVWARDDHAVVAVTLSVDGQAIDEDARVPWYFSPPFALTLPIAGLAPGPHVLTATAIDAAGNQATSAPVTIVAVAEALATYGLGGFGVPTCLSVTFGCDSGPLLGGPGYVGPEENAPNTLGGTCPDTSTRGAIRALRVTALDGDLLRAGGRARVDVTFWSGLGLTRESIDLFVTASPAAPAWTFLGSVHPRLVGGPEVAGLEFDLPAAPLVAVRASYRGTLPDVSSCVPGGAPYAEADDLVFATVH